MKKIYLFMIIVSIFTFLFSAPIYAQGSTIGVYGTLTENTYMFESSEIGLTCSVSPNKFGIQSSFSHVNTSLQNAIYDTNILSLGAQYALFNLKNWSLEPNAGFYLGLPLKTVMINDTTSTLRYNLVKGYYTGISLIRHYNWGSFQIDSGIRNQLDVIPGNYETSGYYTKVMFMIPF